MLTTDHIRRKLFQIVLLLCGFAFFVAFLTDLALQDRLAHLTSQSNITDRWLKGEITKSDDPELKNIWKSLCVGLARADTYFRNPGAIVPKARLLEPSKGDSPDTSFLLPGALEQPRRVYVDFNCGAYYKFNPADFISGVNGAPGAAAPNYGSIPALAVAREDDLERYEKVLYDFVAAVNRANIDNKGDTVEIATRKYSDSMLEFFGVKDIVSKRLPNLTVSNVFAASDNGTLAIFPWNSLNLPELPGWDFKKREWYKSAFEDAPSTEWIQIENKPDQKSFGLAGFYVDAVSGDYIRTLWHKIVVPGNSGPITYVMCVDLNLGALRPQTVSIITLPSRFPNAESLIEAAVYGLEFSLATLVIGALIILPLSMLRPQSLSSLLVHRRPKEWETEEYFTPVSQAFATRGNIMLTTGKKSEKGVEQKISFSAWFSTQIVKISFDKSKNAKNVKV